MPVALILFLPLISSILSSIKGGIQNTAEGKYNRNIAYLLAAVGVYILVTGWKKSQQQAYLTNAGTDPATQQAQALYQAMNPYVFGVGTDEDLIFATAAKITDYSAVADAYRVLYGTELTTDLANDLSNAELQKFWDIVYKRTSTTTTTGSSTSSLIGKTVTATMAVRVRNFDDYKQIDHQATVGENLGTYLGEQSLFIDGQTGVFVIVEKTSWLLFSSKYYVLKNSVKIG